MSEASTAYREVISDLRARIAEHQSAIEALNVAVKVVMDNAPDAAREAESLPPARVPGKFEGLSMRKGVLALFREAPSVGLETYQISASLQAGGMTTQGQSFSSNVSATLSDMAKKYGEVEKVGLRWKLTLTGLAAAEGRPVNQIPMNTDGPTFLANERKRLSQQ